MGQRPSLYEASSRNLSSRHSLELHKSVLWIFWLQPSPPLFITLFIIPTCQGCPMSALQSTTTICHMCLMDTDSLQAWQKNWISISSHFKSHIWHIVVIVLDSRIDSCRKHFPSVSQNVLVFFFSFLCMSVFLYSMVSFLFSIFYL